MLSVRVRADVSALMETILAIADTFFTVLKKHIR
jgi:hypothetical protein